MAMDDEVPREETTQDYVDLLSNVIANAGRKSPFIETARSLECDESEERFNAALGKIARQRPPDDKTKPEKEKAAK